MKKNIANILTAAVFQQLITYSIIMIACSVWINRSFFNEAIVIH